MSDNCSECGRWVQYDGHAESCSSHPTYKFRAEIEALRTNLSKCIEKLREVEWAGYSDYRDEWYCVICGADEADGHKEDCFYHELEKMEELGKGGQDDCILRN